MVSVHFQVFWLKLMVKLFVVFQKIAIFPVNYCPKICNVKVTRQTGRISKLLVLKLIYDVCLIFNLGNEFWITLTMKY